MNTQSVVARRAQPTIRELEPREIDALSGGVATIAIGAGLGAAEGAIAYGYSVAVNGQTFTWTGLAAETVQGGIVGALAGAGGLLFAVNGGVVAGTTAEGVATIIKVTDPAQSLAHDN